MNDILQKLDAIVAQGDEGAVRAFVTQHFAELPEKMQKELAVEMLKEAMEKDLKEKQAIVEMKKEAVEAIDLVEDMEKESANGGV